MMTAGEALAKAEEALVAADDAKSLPSLGAKLDICREWRHLAEDLKRLNGNARSANGPAEWPLPNLPRLIFSERLLSTEAAPTVVALAALARPDIEVLVAADSLGEVETAMEQVLDRVPIPSLAPGRSAVTHRPGLIILANGSRILFRRRARGDGIKGTHPVLVWWIGNFPIPEDVASLVPLTS